MFNSKYYAHAASIDVLFTSYCNHLVVASTWLVRMQTTTNNHVDVIDDGLYHYPSGFWYGLCQKRLAILGCMVLLFNQSLICQDVKPSSLPL